MPKTYLVHRSKNSELEHASNPIIKNGFVTTGQFSKDSNVVNKEVDRGEAEVQKKWKTLIDQQQLNISKYEKALTQAKKDMDALSRIAYSISDSETKNVLNAQAKKIQTMISGYTTNINAAKKAIANYKDRMTAEMRQTRIDLYNKLAYKNGGR